MCPEGVVSTVCSCVLTLYTQRRHQSCELLNRTVVNINECVDAHRNEVAAETLLTIGSGDTTDLMQFGADDHARWEVRAYDLEIGQSNIEFVIRGRGPDWMQRVHLYVGTSVGQRLRTPRSCTLRSSEHRRRSNAPNFCHGKIWRKAAESASCVWCASGVERQMRNTGRNAVAP